MDPLKDIWWMNWDNYLNVLLIGSYRRGNKEYITGYYIDGIGDIKEDGFPIPHFVNKHIPLKKAIPTNIFKDVLRSHISNDPKLITYYKEALKLLSRLT